MHHLDEATRLGGEAGDPRRIGHTSDAYWTFIGPFGGASAATAMRAVLERPDRIGDPIALTVNFCAPIARGEFTVATKVARTNRSSQHWSVELTQAGSDAVVLTASIVTALRRESWSHQSAAPPVSLPHGSRSRRCRHRSRCRGSRNTSSASSRGSRGEARRPSIHRAARARCSGCAMPSRAPSISSRSPP